MALQTSNWKRISQPGYLALALAAGLGVATATAEDWAQFRGPKAIGVSLTARLPEKFDGATLQNIA